MRQGASRGATLCFLIFNLLFSFLFSRRTFYIMHYHGHYGTHKNCVVISPRYHGHYGTLYAHTGYLSILKTSIISGDTYSKIPCPSPGATLVTTTPRNARAHRPPRSRRPFALFGQVGMPTRSDTTQALKVRHATDTLHRDVFPPLRLTA